MSHFLFMLLCYVYLWHITAQQLLQFNICFFSAVSASVVLAAEPNRYWTFEANADVRVKIMISICQQLLTYFLWDNCFRTLNYSCREICDRPISVGIWQCNTTYLYNILSSITMIVSTPSTTTHLIPGLLSNFTSKRSLFIPVTVRSCADAHGCQLCSINTLVSR